MPTKTNYTQSQLKQAYQIVTQDLFNLLVKAKADETIYLGARGAFGSLKKSEGQVTSRLKNKAGDTYVFYRFKFTPSSKLKQALNQALEKKYR
jgi:hypothetical protein